MGCKAFYEQKEGYVLARFDGQESYEEAVAFWKDLLEKSDFKDLEKFLVIGKPDKTLNHVEVEMLCLELAKMGKGKKIAYVDTNEEAFRENSYGEKVALNRGRNARNFNNEKEALAWLLEGEIAKG